MRRVSLLLISLGMLASLVGCNAVTGRCDCVDLPPTVIPPPNHPAPPPAPVAAGAPVMPQGTANLMPGKVEWSKIQPATPNQVSTDQQVVPDSRNK
jgi:hypothetical protein